jgi:hypothetical protein
MNKFLDLLFKFKFLFKAFIYLDYFIRRIFILKFSFNTKFTLTNNKNEIIMSNKKFGKALVAYYMNNYFQYEFLDDTI